MLLTYSAAVAFAYQPEFAQLIDSLAGRVRAALTIPEGATKTATAA